LTLLIAACAVYSLVIFCLFYSKQESGADGLLSWILSFSDLLLFSCLLFSGQCSVLKTDPDKNKGPSATNGGRAEDGRST